MSFSISALVWSKEFHSANAKFVMLKLADNANDKGECWPSYLTIAKYCGLSRQTAIAQITKLESYDLLKIEPRKGKKGSASNRYKLNLKSIELLPNVKVHSSSEDEPPLDKQIDHPSQTSLLPLVKQLDHPSQTSLLPLVKELDPESISKPIIESKKIEREKKRFVKPSVSEVYDHMKLQGQVDYNIAEQFFHYYESNGWLVGKNKMKSWESAINGWLSRNKSTKPKNSTAYALTIAYDAAEKRSGNSEF
ncbi:helix-turn-helix domain-containing protein [Glaciecola sp. 2405UD65-10]|uniref:helix-turn-helix domain-containing protein n=1 Tax=Glaciecola sp. 2405UD65-10 TaxID=3397244 RepID=UPI003B593032